MKGYFFNLFIAIFIFTFSQITWGAKSLEDTSPLPLKYNFEKVFQSNRLNLKQKLSLHVRRFKRENATPIILSHALVLNNTAMENLGRELWKKGHDVWMPNMRGHGNGRERSTITPYIPGDYGFDKMLAYDLPLIVNKVSHLTGKKVHLMGLSMGALLWHKYLSGFGVDNEGNLTKSKDRSFKRGQKNFELQRIRSSSRYFPSKRTNKNSSIPLKPTR